MLTKAQATNLIKSEQRLRGKEKSHKWAHAEFITNIKNSTVEEAVYPFCLYTGALNGIKWHFNSVTHNDTARGISNLQTIRRFKVADSTSKKAKQEMEREQQGTIERLDKNHQENYDGEVEYIRLGLMVDGDIDTAIAVINNREADKCLARATQLRLIHA